MLGTAPLTPGTLKLNNTCRPAAAQVEVLRTRVSNHPGRLTRRELASLPVRSYRLTSIRRTCLPILCKCTRYSTRNDGTSR